MQFFESQKKITKSSYVLEPCTQMKIGFLARQYWTVTKQYSTFQYRTVHSSTLEHYKVQLITVTRQYCTVQDSTNYNARQYSRELYSAGSICYTVQ